jgi:hypothetical protein
VPANGLARGIAASGCSFWRAILSVRRKQRNALLLNRQQQRRYLFENICVLAWWGTTAYGGGAAMQLVTYLVAVRLYVVVLRRRFSCRAALSVAQLLYPANGGYCLSPGCDNTSNELMPVRLVVVFGNSAFFLLLTFQLCFLTAFSAPESGVS